MQPPRLGVSGDDSFSLSSRTLIAHLRKLSPRVGLLGPLRLTAPASGRFAYRGPIRSAKR